MNDFKEKFQKELERDLELHSQFPKSWWSGDKRVEPYMVKVSIALDRSGLENPARTDVYNRAYEAVYQAIIDSEKQNKVSNVKATI